MGTWRVNVRSCEHAIELSEDQWNGMSFFCWAKEYKLDTSHVDRLGKRPILLTASTTNPNKPESQEKIKCPKASIGE
jgi:hypothetical protein